jgi:oligosaccharyltransferase complex subunit beta
LPPDRTGVVVDHFNYDISSAAEKHDVLVLPVPAPVRPDIKNFFSDTAPEGAVLALPSTMGQTLGASALLTPVLRAPSTAYSYNPKEQGEVVDDLFASGAQLSLVTTLQARNSARFTILGSAEMLTDKWFDAKVKKAGEDSAVSTWNREFAKRVSGWTFNEIGALRVNWIEHHLNEEGQSNQSNPKIYRIKNDVVCRPLPARLYSILRLTSRPDLLNLHVRIRMGPLGSLRRPRGRCVATRVLYAVSLPPPGPDLDCDLGR